VNPHPKFTRLTRTPSDDLDFYHRRNHVPLILVFGVPYASIATRTFGTNIATTMPYTRSSQNIDPKAPM